jgi:hypothetical protein
MKSRAVTASISDRIKIGLRKGTIPSDYGTLELAEYAYSQGQKDFLEEARKKSFMLVDYDEETDRITDEGNIVLLSDLEAFCKKGEG